MCNIINERRRINITLIHTVNMRLDRAPVSVDELTKLCIIALQIYYGDSCPHECLEARARNFVLWHLAQLKPADSSSTTFRLSIPA